MAAFEDFNEIKAADHGHYLSALCLWHDDSTPSMMIYKDGFFICLSCGAQGGFGKLWARLCEVRGHRPLKPQKHDAPMLDLPDWDDVEGLEELRYAACTTLLKYPNMRWYLDRRGLSIDTQEICGLGWYKEWIVIPILSRAHDLAGLVLRATPGKSRETGLRYLIPRGQPPLPYCPSWYRLDNSPVLFTTFGAIDAMTLFQLGYGVLTSTNGKDNLNPAWLDDQRKPIGIIPDKGEYQAAARLCSGLDWRGHLLELKYPAGCKDPNDILVQPGGDDLLKEQLNDFVERHTRRINK